MQILVVGCLVEVESTDVLEESCDLGGAVLTELFDRCILFLLEIVSVVLFFSLELLLLLLVGQRVFYIDLVILRLWNVPGHVPPIEEVNDDVA